MKGQSSGISEVFKMQTVKIESNLSDEILEVRELLEELHSLEENIVMIRFLTINDFAEISGWSLPIVKKLFNRADFPSCDYGRKKVVEVSAAKKYFSVPRRK